MTSAVMGRRESNKQEKLERITKAASTLFRTIAVDEVSTSEISDLAGIAAGTLFLYVKTKGELLLLAQNSKYRDAHQKGEEMAKSKSGTTDALVSLFEPIVRCNREHVDNGRRYLQEVMFGDPTHPHRQQALSLMVATEESSAGIIASREGISKAEADLKASAVSAILFLTMSSPLNVSASIEELLQTLKLQIAQVLT